MKAGKEPDFVWIKWYDDVERKELCEYLATVIKQTVTRPDAIVNMLASCVLNVNMRLHFTEPITLLTFLNQVPLPDPDKSGAKLMLLLTYTNIKEFANNVVDVNDDCEVRIERKC